MYNVKITKEAKRDIEEIFSYIYSVLDNPIAANNFLNELEKSYLTVRNNPQIYACCNDARLRKSGYRKIIVKNYIAFYKVNVAENTIYIMRVIYGRRDYTKLI